MKTFAGPRDEPFFVDLHVFDLLGVGGAPTTDGINVMSLVLEMPISELTDGARPTDSTAPEAVLGIYARSMRRRARLLGRNHNGFRFGGLTQVSRLGWPLINEVIIGLKQFDRRQANPRAQKCRHQ